MFKVFNMLVYYFLQNNFTELIFIFIDMMLKNKFFDVKK